MTTAYFIGLTNVMDSVNHTWEKEVAEIKSIKPDKIFCIGMEEGDPLNWFTFPLFEKLVVWLEKSNKFITVIGGIKKLVHERLSSDRIRSRVIHEEALGCIFWASSAIYEEDRKHYDLSKAPKLFTCYNYNQKLHRALLVDELARYDLIKEGIVSLHNPHLYAYEDNKPYLWKYHNGSPLYDEDPNYTIVANILPKSFKQGFFDIVTETCYGPEEFMITEKTLKSLGMAKPFIALACKGYHSYLRDSLGIKLYDEMFDYSFDQCDKIEDRIEGIVNNVLRLKDILSSEEDKRKMYGVIKEKLEYNLRIREAAVWDLNVGIPKSLHFLLTDEPHKLYGQKGISVLGVIEDILQKLDRKLNWMDK